MYVLALVSAVACLCLGGIVGRTQPPPLYSDSFSPFSLPPVKLGWAFRAQDYGQAWDLMDLSLTGGDLRSMPLFLPPFLSVPWRSLLLLWDGFLTLPPRAEGVTQEQSICLACVRPWVPTSADKNYPTKFTPQVRQDLVQATAVQSCRPVNPEMRWGPGEMPRDTWDGGLTELCAKIWTISVGFSPLLLDGYPGPWGRLVWLFACQ